MTTKNITAPSIGSIGLTVDTPNQRVKVLYDKEFNSAADVQEYLRNLVAAHTQAIELLDGDHARFTARVFCEKGIETIGPFCIGNSLCVAEEARISTNSGLDIVYVGGNRSSRFIETQLQEEALFIAKQQAVPVTTVFEPNVTVEQLRHPLSSQDVDQLLEMYALCYTDYLVTFDETLLQNAARGAIFIVARDASGRIIASAIGESLRVGRVTLYEISEVAAHPNYRVKGAASGCVRRVIQEGHSQLQAPLVVFWEARMWVNIVGIGLQVGLSQFGGILHQHCKIAAPASFTSLQQTTEHGSLGVFYASY